MTLWISRRARIAIAALALLAAAGSASAERILFQRGGSLYVSGTDGKDIRSLFVIGDPRTVAWSPSPDGRRIAWYTYRHPDSVLSFDPGAKRPPISIWISDLSGRRRKVLFSTSDLRDLQGNRIKTSWTGRSVPVTEWSPVSIAWGPGGRTLYLSCIHLSRNREHATFIVDAQTGSGVVDSEGRWKSIAPVVQVDARYPLLVGIGTDTARDTARADNAYLPLLVTDMTQSKTTSLLETPFVNGAPLPYRIASSPALSPDTKTIAFTAIGDGLWQVDTSGRNYRRITDRLDDGSPRWSEDGKRLYFLSANSSGGETNDIFSMSAPFNSARRRLIVSKVDRYYLIPD